MTDIHFTKKILTPKKLEHIVIDIYKRHPKKKIVFTNGCFDILHPGHVHYLAQARALGHYLIVALDTDASVRQLKGPTRPINSLKNRAQVIAALESVSFVTSFGGGNPAPLIKRLKPNVLVKGGDWPIEAIKGADYVQSTGGRVYALKFIPGNSTTKIIEKIYAKKR